MTQPPSSPLSRQSLSTPVIATYHAGGFYEIDHGMLPPRTPIHLKSIRVVQVSEYTSLDVTVSFPSLQALRSFFSSFPAPSAGPELDERFVMSSNHAARILCLHGVEQELEGEIHQDSFWLVNPCLFDFSASSDPATLPDALSSHEAPPAQLKAPAPISCLLGTFNFDAPGWGRHPYTSKEASMVSYKTEASVKERQPLMPEGQTGLISGKMIASACNRKPSNESKGKKTYKSPKMEKKCHALSGFCKRPCAFLFLAMLFLVAIIPRANGATCEPSSLSSILAKSCIQGPHIKTLECCMPLLTAIDETPNDGIECLCSLSHEHTLQAAGFTYTELRDLYSTCGGLNEDLAEQASCRVENPPVQSLSPTSTPRPPPSVPAASSVSLPVDSSAAPPPPTSPFKVVEWPSDHPMPYDLPTKIAIEVGEIVGSLCMYYITDYFAPWLVEAIRNAIIWIFRIIAKGLMWLFGAALRAIKRCLKPANAQRQTEMVAAPVEGQTGTVPLTLTRTMPIDVP